MDRARRISLVASFAGGVVRDEAAVRLGNATPADKLSFSSNQEVCYFILGDQFGCAPLWPGVFCL
jgi:hypothetical protein